MFLCHRILTNLVEQPRSNRASGCMKLFDLDRLTKQFVHKENAFFSITHFCIFFHFNGDRVLLACSVYVCPVERSVCMPFCVYCACMCVVCVCLWMFYNYIIVCCLFVWVCSVILYFLMPVRVFDHRGTKLTEKHLDAKKKDVSSIDSIWSKLSCIIIITCLLLKTFQSPCLVLSQSCKLFKLQSCS